MCLFRKEKQPSQDKNQVVLHIGESIVKTKDKVVFRCNEINATFKVQNPDDKNGASYDLIRNSLISTAYKYDWSDSDEFKDDFAGAVLIEMRNNSDDGGSNCINLTIDTIEKVYQA